jgi:hypothetical protein
MGSHDLIIGFLPLYAFIIYVKSKNPNNICKFRNHLVEKESMVKTLQFHSTSDFGKPIVKLGSNMESISKVQRGI